MERGLSRYSTNTAFVRAADFADFLVECGELSENSLKEWKEENPKLFQHSYVKKRVEMTFAEAVSRINQINVADIREKALQLLATGMRYTESTTLNEEGEIVGKGGRRRAVPLAEQFNIPEFKKSYAAVYKQLRQVGLTPHMLRKICATEHAKQGATEADLMNIFGWRSSQMAHMYVQAQRTEELAQKLAKKITKETKKNGK
jgi:integrase